MNKWNFKILDCKEKETSKFMRNIKLIILFKTVSNLNLALINRQSSQDNHQPHTITKIIFWIKLVWMKPCCFWISPRTTLFTRSRRPLQTSKLVMDSFRVINISEKWTVLEECSHPTASNKIITLLTKNILWLSKYSTRQSMEKVYKS